MGKLEAALKEAVEAVRRMAPEDQAAMWEAQRRSFVRAEVGFGSDADEAAYYAAIRRGDHAEVARLKAEQDDRLAAFDAAWPAPVSENGRK